MRGYNAPAQDILKAELGEKLLDFRKFCPSFLKIKDKQGRLVPFEWNRPQIRFYDEYVEPNLLAGLPIRARILKARQMGFSTFIEAFGFWYTYTNFGISGAVMAHLGESAQHLYQMYRTFYDCLDPLLQIEIERSNVKEMRFKKLRSAMRVMTAETREGAGRSPTLQFLHTSETAFYPDADATMNALLQALTMQGHHFDESTANGVGGRFYNDWKASKAGETNMKPCFFAWHEMEEYRLGFMSQDHLEIFKTSLTPEELSIGKAHRLDLEQLHWRRDTIQNKCGGDERIFQQEYPSDDDEAFLTTGTAVFDQKYVQGQYDRTKKIHPVKFSLIKNDGGQVTAKVDEAGWWRIFKLFRVKTGETNRFAVGTDVAEGLAQGDYSSMDVYDRLDGTYPLKFHAHCDPDELAQEQEKLHIWLKGSATFCTERNNHGILTVVNAGKLGVPQYYDKRFDTGLDVDSDALGFKTTVSSRPMLLGRLIQAMREQSVTDDDHGYWDEARTFVRNDKGKMTAQDKDKDPATKCFDDRIFSKALALHCHEWMDPYNFYSESEEKRKWREYEEWATRNKMKIKRQVSSKASYS